MKAHADSAVLRIEQPRFRPAETVKEAPCLANENCLLTKSYAVINNLLERCLGTDQVHAVGFVSRPLACRHVLKTLRVYLIMNLHKLNKQ